MGKKTNPKLTAAVAIGMASMLLAQESERNLEAAKKRYLEPMTDEDKYRAQGLKPFNFPDGVIVWAINQKNADKKYKRDYGSK